MSTPVFKFCLSCGAPRQGNAAFCGACGSPFPAPDVQASPAPAVATMNGTKGAWRVIAGEVLPEASKLFTLAQRAPTSGTGQKSASVMPVSKGKPLWGSALWMSLTQTADMVTREMEGGNSNDPYVSLRVGVAAAVAVFSLMLSPLPRLRSILVRLGTLVIAVMQGQGLVPVVQSLVTDPSLISTFAPNLAAQAAGLMALLQLFIAARARPS